MSESTHGRETMAEAIMKTRERNNLNEASALLNGQRECGAREAHYCGHLPPPPCLSRALPDHSLPLPPASGRWDCGTAAEGSRSLASLPQCVFLARAAASRKSLFLPWAHVDVGVELAVPAVGDKSLISV